MVKLTATVPTGTTDEPTVIGPTPTISHPFDKTGALAVPGLPACSVGRELTGGELTPTLPAVTADKAISFTHDVWFETDCSAVGFLTSTAQPQEVTVRWNPPWTITALTAGPLTLRPGEVAELRFQVGGRPGVSASLGIEAPAAASGWFPGLPKTVTSGPNPVAVAFTPPAGTPGGTMGTFVGGPDRAGRQPDPWLAAWRSSSRSRCPPPGATRWCQRSSGACSRRTRPSRRRSAALG